jgi:hypothetical protein
VVEEERLDDVPYQEYASEEEAPEQRAGEEGCWNYSFVRTESNTSVMLPTAERQPTAVIIRPYVTHSTVYIGDYRPIELVIIKQCNLFHCALIFPTKVDEEIYTKRVQMKRRQLSKGQ